MPEIEVHLFKNNPRRRTRTPRVAPKAKRTSDGFLYDSLAERKYGGILRSRQRNGELADVKRQVHYELRVNGELICNHDVDCGVTLNDGTFELHEVKRGYLSDLYRFKARLLRATALKEDPEIKYRIFSMVGPRTFVEIPW